MRFLILPIIALLFFGCSPQPKVQKEYIGYVKDIKKQTRTPLRDTVVELKAVKDRVSLVHPKKISQVLRELSDINGKIYVLDHNSQDIDVPTIKSKLLRIKTYFDIKSYLENRTDYTLVISKNELSKSKPKIVKVIHKDTIKFKKINVEIKSTNGIVVSILDRVAHATGYNIAYVQDDGANDVGGKNAEGIEYTKAKHLSFSRKLVTAYDILKYVSESLNLYVDIDHANKIIKISKYKVKYFKLVTNNLIIQGSMEAKEVSSDGESSSSSSNKNNMSAQTSIKVFGELEDGLKDIILKNTKFDNKNAYVQIDKVTGEIAAKASKKTMDQIQEMIQRFNDTYGKMIEFELEVLEVLVRKKIGGGIDLSIVKDAVLKDTKIDFVTNFTNNGQLTVKNTTGNGSSSFTTEALNNFGTIVNRKKYVFNMHNNLPYSRNKATTIEYDKVSSLVQTGTTATGAPLYTTKRETGEVNDGFVFLGKAMVDGERISINLNLNFTALLKLNKKVLGDETYESPEISKDSFSGEIKINSGERFVIDSLSVKAKAKDYEGLVPLEDFILGGSVENEYLERELIFIGRAIIKE